MDLPRQIAIARRWLPLLVASVVLAGAAAFLVSGLLPKVYEAKATLIVGQSLSASNPDYTQLLVSQRLSATYAQVATMRPVLVGAIQQLGLQETPDELSKRVRADAAPDSTLLTIAAQDANPPQAAALANAMAQQLIAISPAIQGRQTDLQKSIAYSIAATQRQIDATEAELELLVNMASPSPAQVARTDTLQARLVTLQSTYAALVPVASGNAASLVSLIESAAAPIAPISPKPLLNALVAAMLGLLVALGVVYAIEYFHDTIVDSAAVEEAIGLSTVGTIPRMKRAKGQGEIYRLATILYPRSAASESYRMLRTNIEFASIDSPIRTLLVASSTPGEGKSVTAANLAVAFAQAGRRVILVDSDLRKPGVHLLFNLENTHGLTTMLGGDRGYPRGELHLTEQVNLRILTTGALPANPAELIGSQRMLAVIEQLRGDADLLIFDSPPLNAVTDAAILSSFLDGTILVIDASRSRRRAVRHGREALSRAGGRVLGAVLNGVPGSGSSAYGGYYGDDSEAANGGTSTAPVTGQPPSGPAL